MRSSPAASCAATGPSVSWASLRIRVIAAPCDPRWTSPGGLALAGPHYFGYETDYLPFGTV
ncbi:hypothetical protein GCM10023205_35140 [Yinghuangia aomiensis]|uniref:S-Me-THD-like C-terminal domain-containing protein n=1 Tax=Yinghuangia aomiensis TaxID=676205 RepID=A0ABP9HCH1_9ACTN